MKKLFNLLTVLMCTIMMCICAMTASAEESPTLENKSASKVMAQNNFSNLRKTTKLPIVKKGGVGSSKALTYKKPFTLMVYMCGSNLESGPMSFASRDIVEMCSSRFREDNLNVVVLTGGAYRWDPYIREETNCQVHVVKNGEFNKQYGYKDYIKISNPALIIDFVNWSMENFPADKYGLIFWDHGGGAIDGYGSDELNNGRIMTIPEIRYALENTYLAYKKAEFIGFDACLMATTEVASSLKDFAHYLVASEELEPGSGWNYSFLKPLSENPYGSFNNVGREILSRFVKYNQVEEDKNGTARTLSVIDLSQIWRVENALARLDYGLLGLLKDRSNKTEYLKMLKRVKGFDKRERDHFDLKDYATQLYLAKWVKGVHASNAIDLKDAIDYAVSYNETSKNVNDANGLSIYIHSASKNEVLQKYKAQDISNYSYFFGTKFSVEDEEMGISSYYNHSLINFNLGNIKDSYRSSDSNFSTKVIGNDVKSFAVAIPQEKTSYIVNANYVLWRQLKPKSDYFIRLHVGDDSEYKDGEYKSNFDGHIWTFNGEPIYLKESDNTDTVIKYTAPAYLNGQRVRLNVDYDKATKIAAIKNAYVVTDNNLSSRNYLSVKKGDKLELRYWANLWPKAEKAAKYKGKPTHKWVKGKKMIVGDDLTLKLQEIGNELYLANFYIKEVNEDLSVSEYYTQNVEIRKAK